MDHGRCSQSSLSLVILWKRSTWAPIAEPTMGDGWQARLPDERTLNRCGLAGHGGRAASDRFVVGTARVPHPG